MAFVPTTSPFHGASGRLGDIVFRTTKNGKTVMSARPVRRKQRASKAQKENQQRFAEMTKAKCKK